MVRLGREVVCVASITDQAEDNATGRLLESNIESVNEFYRENLLGIAACKSDDANG